MLLLVLVSACANAEVDPSSEAFIGPLSNDLIVTATTDCAHGRIGVGDPLRVSGLDFSPDSVVTLRWVVKTRNDTGTWKSVVADDDGEISVPLRIRRSIAEPGEIVSIQAQGEGVSGLMVLAVELEVGDC